MDSMRLVVGRGELMTALGILSARPLRRGTSTMPFWLSFDPQGQELRISEDRGKIAASMPANGEWPPAGATVDLFMLRRGAAVCGEVIELHAVEDAILLPTPGGHVRLNLVCFEREHLGPPTRLPQPDMHSDLPLFRWARPFHETPLQMIGRVARLVEARARIKREEVKRRGQKLKVERQMMQRRSGATLQLPRRR